MEEASFILDSADIICLGITEINMMFMMLSGLLRDTHISVFRGYTPWKCVLGRHIIRSVYSDMVMCSNQNTKHFKWGASHIWGVVDATPFFTV